MYTITKRFKDFPAAHRQHKHDGHCAHVHGHNWTFELTFASETLDENGFIIDFGKMKFIKNWLADMFDHTLLINQEDPELDFFMSHDKFSGRGKQLWDVRVIPNGSAEDLAGLVFDEVSHLLRENGFEQELVSVSVYEDEKNSATFINPSVKQ